MGRRGSPLTSSTHRPKKKIPLPIKRVRKEIPRPALSFKEKKQYDRKRAKQELERALREASFHSDSSPAKKGKVSS